MGPCRLWSHCWHETWLDNNMILVAFSSSPCLGYENITMPASWAMTVILCWHEIWLVFGCIQFPHILQATNIRNLMLKLKYKYDVYKKSALYQAGKCCRVVNSMRSIMTFKGTVSSCLTGHGIGVLHVVLDSMTENNTPHGKVTAAAAFEPVILIHCVKTCPNSDTDSMPCWKSAVIMTILSL